MLTSKHTQQHADYTIDTFNIVYGNSEKSSTNLSCKLNLCHPKTQEKQRKCYKYKPRFNLPNNKITKLNRTLINKTES